MRFHSLVIRKPALLRQSVTLVGLHSESFADDLNSLRRFTRNLSRFFSKESFQSWEASQYQEYDCVELSNRYFTSNRFVGRSTKKNFTDAIDPYRILRNVEDRHPLVHMDDNSVEYFRYHGNPQEQRFVFL